MEIVVMGKLYADGDVDQALYKVSKAGRFTPRDLALILVHVPG